MNKFVLPSVSWSDLPLELCEKIYESFSVRERRVFRQLNKACREHVCHKLIKHLSVHASALAINSFVTANQTLMQLFSNLCTLNLVMDDTDTTLAFLGNCVNITRLDISINGQLTEQLCTALSTQFPSLRSLALSKCDGALTKALHGLCNLIHLTSLAVQSRNHDGYFPRPMLDQFPTALHALRSLKISEMQTDGLPYCSILHQAAQLTCLLLDLRGNLHPLLATGRLLPLAERPCLHHLELPTMDGQISGSWLQSLSQLTYLSAPHTAICVDPLVTNTDSPFANLQHLCCLHLKLDPAVVHSELLPQVTSLEVDGEDYAAAVATIQQCPRLQQLSILMDSFSGGVQDIRRLKELASAVPASRVSAVHGHQAVNKILIELTEWHNLVAAHIHLLDDLHVCSDALVASLSHIRSLCVQSCKASGFSISRTCAGLPALREFVLIPLYERNDIPFASASPEHTSELASALAGRQLRISLAILPNVRVWELNRDLQDLGCDGLRIDNSESLEFW